MRRTGRPTIRDVAQAAGVSPAAVSKVLRHAPGVSENMRLIVNRAIEELGYRPRVGARTMRGSGYTLGLVLPGFSSTFFPTIYEGVADEIAGTGYRAIVALKAGADHGELQIVLDLVDRQVDGLILVAPTIERRALEGIAEHTPLVVVARHDSSARYDTVRSDDALGTEQVMSHLFDLGHRKIVHIANRGSRHLARETPHGDYVRRVSYERIMREAGLSHEALVVESVFEERAAQLSTMRLFEEGHRPSAIFAGADEAAFGVMRALNDLSAIQPVATAVVGWDNTRFADHPNISLTSVDQFGHELGRRSAALLLDRFTRDRPSVQESIAPRLVVRKSSTPEPVPRPTR